MINYHTFIIMFFFIYITGTFILLIAISTNILANYFNILTWYHFIEDAKEKGLIHTIRTMRFLDFMWLFLFYPMTLSFGYILGEMFCCLIKIKLL